MPGTSYQCREAKSSEDSSLDARIGEVTNHIVLDHYIVFITHKNKVFVYPADIDSSIAEPIELTTFSQLFPGFQIEDIQGQMCNFGIFSSNGTVLLGNSNLLESFIRASQLTIQPHSKERLQPRILPALQNSSVISLAFGDYHFHALHSDGTISSYGTEPQCCGALGLEPRLLANLRGALPSINDRKVSLPLWNPDGRRTIWFEPEKTQWLKDLVEQAGGNSEAITAEEIMSRGGTEALHVWSEWFEREGRAWHFGPKATNSSASESPDAATDKGAYFALKITAAGWHSGALVLVDEEKAEHVRQKWLMPPKSDISKPERHVDGQSPLVQVVSEAGTWLYETGRWFLGLTERDAHQKEDQETVGEQPPTYVWANDTLPRLRLPNGEEMPGTAPLAAWRGGEPDFNRGS